MKYLVCIVFLLFTVSEMGAQYTTTAATFNINAAERFANLALACVHKEYPNNDSSAAAGERTIVSAEVGYYASYPTVGYTKPVSLGWRGERSLRSEHNHGLPARQQLGQQRPRRPWQSAKMGHAF